MGVFQRGVFQKTTFQLSSVPTTTEETATGGWAFFTAYEQHAKRRRKQEEEEQARQEEAQQIQDKLDRDIAILLRRQEAIDERKQYLERLGQLATLQPDLEAARNYSDRVAKAYERAVTQQNYSALEALDRELQRAQEEEDFLTLAILMLENDE